MRKDMAKVIVERPRVGGGLQDPKGYKKEFHDTPWDEQPKREQMQRRWDRTGWEKHLSERLGPLWRWLLSKVGQSWDVIYSELCENLRRDSAVQDHVRDHVDGFVERCVIIKDGIPCHGDGILYGMHISDYGDRLYVHPQTGLLTFIKGSGRYRRKDEKPKDTIRKDDTHIYKKIDGIWYEVEVVPYEPQYREHVHFIGKHRHAYKSFIGFRDMLIGDVKNPWESTDYYGACVKAISKRQLNKKEIKRLAA